MANPEGSPEDSKEREQTPEEVREVVLEAIEKQLGALLTQQREDGSTITNPALPISLEGGKLEVDAGGYGFSIDLDSVIKAELMKEEE